MAKKQKKSILQGIRGAVENVVTRQMRDGSIRVSVKPVKKQHTSWKDLYQEFFG